MAEREGFEPSVRVYTYTRLAGERLRPLGHLSSCVRAGNTIEPLLAAQRGRPRFSYPVEDFELEAEPRDISAFVGRLPFRPRRYCRLQNFRLHPVPEFAIHFEIDNHSQFQQSKQKAHIDAINERLSRVPLFVWQFAGSSAPGRGRTQMPALQAYRHHSLGRIRHAPCRPGGDTSLQRRGVVPLSVAMVLAG